MQVRGTSSQCSAQHGQPRLGEFFRSLFASDCSRVRVRAVWDLYERVLLASLDAHDDNASRWALDALSARWPGSARVKRLQAQAAEARGHFAEADDAYAELLEADPTNIAALRRQVAVAKGAGQLGGAIAMLNRFVRVYSSDEAAWVELSELYCQTQQYELASFAVEELLMIAPENYIYHVRYAELAYTLGAVDTARQYYSQSLELKPHNNLRALHGLNLVLQTQTSALRSWTADQLLAHYAKFAPALTPVVVATINGDAAAPAVATTTTPAVAAASVAQREEKVAATTPAAAGAAAEPTAEVDDVDEPASPQESELPD